MASSVIHPTTARSRLLPCARGPGRATRMGACCSVRRKQTAKAPTCIFCNIISSQSPRILYQDDVVVAFPDIRPAAARHLLVIPRQHIPNTSSLQGSHAPLVRHMLEVGKLILARKDNGAISDEAIKTDVLSTGQAPLATQLQGQQTRRNPQLQTQWQSGVFKFGFHKPPFRSVDHLHMHCFELPHKGCTGIKYVLPLNWITAEQLLDQLSRMPSPPPTAAAAAAQPAMPAPAAGSGAWGVAPVRDSGVSVQQHREVSEDQV